MSWLQPFEPVILAVHLVICVFLVITILLQAGKGADMGATFGAGGSQSLFGARGAATFLSKITTVGALLFLVTSISLASIHRQRAETGAGESAVEEVLKDEKPASPAPEQAPAAPQPAPSEAPKP